MEFSGWNAGSGQICTRTPTTQVLAKCWVRVFQMKPWVGLPSVLWARSASSVAELFPSTRHLHSCYFLMSRVHSNFPNSGDAHYPFLWRFLCLQAQMHWEAQGWYLGSLEELSPSIAIMPPPRSTGIKENTGAAWRLHRGPATPSCPPTSTPTVTTEGAWLSLTFHRALCSRWSCSDCPVMTRDFTAAVSGTETTSYSSGWIWLCLQVRADWRLTGQFL